MVANMTRINLVGGSQAAAAAVRGTPRPEQIACLDNEKSLVPDQDFRCSKCLSHQITKICPPEATTTDQPEQKCSTPGCEANCLNAVHLCAMCWKASWPTVPPTPTGHALNTVIRNAGLRPPPLPFPLEVSTPGVAAGKRFGGRDLRRQPTREPEAEPMVPKGTGGEPKRPNEALCKDPRSPVYGQRRGRARSDAVYFCRRVSAEAPLGDNTRLAA
jgi:hypothetical protein